ncbi:unnamed protein product [Diatraea saccharalis]|uniref:Uncharacterized protein n=1 Tax=Diatraea saccharalis TaxID=40085 RepID=A0A9N9QYU7_9NEOP|nr:unnamed protein product [Diatraea saccharalis]
MERGRKSRRGRYHSSNRNMPHINTPPQQPKPHSFLHSLYTFFIMSTLMALIYMMLQYHCQNCRDKCDINNISKNLDDIAKNLSKMKDGYYDLELKISKFSQELPKLEGQIDILEALANTMEKKQLDNGDPQIRQLIPTVDNYLKMPEFKNKSEMCTTCSAESLKREVNQD